MPKIKGPKNSAAAVMFWAARIDRAREEIIVATILLESFKPLRNANRRARKITAMMTGDTNFTNFQTALQLAIVLPYNS